MIQSVVYLCGMKLFRQSANAGVKNHLCLLLAFFVLVSNVGFAINVHYCDDQIASVSFNTAVSSSIDEDCCGVIEEVSHCCKDKVVVIQKKSDQAVVKSFSREWQDLIFQAEWIPVAIIKEQSFENKKAVAYYFDSHPPPLYQLYSQYLFYDWV